MTFRVLFVSIALVAITTFAFAQNANVQFNYYGPIEYFGYHPMTQCGNGCFDGTPIPDGAASVVVYAGGSEVGSFLMNGDANFMGPGYFYGDYVPGPPNLMWYCVVSTAHCTYTSPEFGPYPTGPASVSIAESDWTCECDCGPPPPTCVWIDMHESLCLTFTGGGEENGIQICWCCPYGLDPVLNPTYFEWRPGCEWANDPWEGGCDEVCDPLLGDVHGINPSFHSVVETDTLCNPNYPGIMGHWTTLLWVDNPGCICLYFDAQLPVELAAAPVLQIGDRQLTLSFEVADESNVLHYNVMRDGAKVAELDRADGSYTFVDQNLVNGRRYEYSIVAVGVDETSELEFSDNTVWSATPSFKAAVVTEYALHQNYPNPFNPSTEIVYDVLDQTHVTLKVYNVMGQEVATLVNSDMATGRYAVTFDATGLTSGLYFYTVSMGDFTATKKMLLVQ